MTPNIKKKRLDSRSFIQLRFGDSKQVGSVEYHKEFVPQPCDKLLGEDGVHLHRYVGRPTTKTCSWCERWRGKTKVCLNCGSVLSAIT